MTDDKLLLNRRIVCAAIRINGQIICGVRHWDMIMRLTMAGLKLKAPNAMQGFVDNHGYFVTREQAWEIALAAKQFNPAKHVGPQGELFSEDLY
jgi:hypothetical protein